MNSKPTLLILAAGIGSRYGGIKQLDGLGPHGETIMDYSVSDARVSGFGKVVFVIRREIEDDFKRLILPKYEQAIEVDYVFQETSLLPEGFVANPNRTKPYGTAQAVLAAKPVIKENFSVINADDFYGKEAFEVLYAFLTAPHEHKTPRFAMVGYRLDKTLSDNGSVTRGICETNAENKLQHISEVEKISKVNEKIVCLDPATHEEKYLAPDTTVSMNCWGFTPEIFPFIEEQFVDFLKHHNDNPKSEFLLPTVVDYMIKTNKAEVDILKSNAEWFGITYHEDRATVVEKLKKLTTN
ncbi:MAG: nucleotidyltransferase [Bacteroidales bacterium]|jgi:dTDP-glucose pyrophosphorylase|nr:nucleotidyltransferase [Bacteroidales bacterium]